MKYQRVTGWWVYVIKTPDNMYYPGYSGGKDGNKQLCQRWQATLYKGTGLYPYIKQFGWENLEKIVLVDGLTMEEALQWEGRLINMYKRLGCCINKQRSGRPSKLEYDREYSKQYRQSHRNEINIKSRKYNKTYYQRHREEILEKKKKSYQNNLN